jgi:hypothetical protein
MDLPRPSSVHSVEFQKVGEIIRRQQVVNGGQMQRWIFEYNLQSRPANSSQAMIATSSISSFSSCRFDRARGIRVDAPYRDLFPPLWHHASIATTTAKTA